MSFRTKVLVSISVPVAIAVWLVAYLISARITRTYELRESVHAADLVTQFRREFARRGDEIAARVAAIAASQTLADIALNPTDLAQYVNAAEPLAREHRLDVLAIVAPDASIISSAHWPARFGYREDWLAQPSGWNNSQVFLKREELADTSVLALLAVRTVPLAEGMLYVYGGAKLDQRFVETLPVPPGMSVAVYREGDDLRSLAPDIASLVHQARTTAREQTRLVRTAVGEAAAATFPLTGRDNQVLAVLVALQDRNELIALRRHVYLTALLVGLSAVTAAMLLGFWSASRVTRPVRRLAGTARQIAAGDWEARAQILSHDEIGQLATDFNNMAAQLLDQRNRMLQAERVAAWREIARRLAHELKNPLFPLQITVENLKRSRQAGAEDFEEVFEESTSTLLTELNNLKTIIGRFGDFARMPAPQVESVDINQIVREAMRLFESQAHSQAARPEIRTHLDLASSLPPIQADPEQIGRALRNLATNALDAMPKGGDLTIRTRHDNGRVIIEVADTGEGLTPEESARLFTPYYTTKQHGTGLGLAIVQSVVSDHGGSIGVESQQGSGTIFRIELKA